jgi:hypothetical protein
MKTKSLNQLKNELEKSFKSLERARAKAYVAKTTLDAAVLICSKAHQELDAEVIRIRANCRVSNPVTQATQRTPGDFFQLEVCESRL